MMLGVGQVFRNGKEPEKALLANASGSTWLMHQGQGRSSLGWSWPDWQDRSGGSTWARLGVMGRP